MARPAKPAKKSAPAVPTRLEPVAQHCETCRQELAVCDGVHYGSAQTGYRLLCSRCFNEEVAEAGGLDFQHVQFDPLEMRDATGGRHEFHFRVHLLGDRVALDAFELRGGEPRGYQFQVLDDAEVDLFALMGRLVERMRRLLASCHLEEDHGLLHIKDLLARGRIEWDENEDGRVPLIVIDGREIPWEDFGRMLMTFEGWQFKLEIRDKSEEI
jgi:hypothetical protein